MNSKVDETSDLPFVSIIMPIRNEARSITGCLSAVLRQSYPARLMEVLIADGMSTDETRDVIQQICQADDNVDDGRVIVLDNPGRFVASGLNIAIARAKGDVIVRVDGHTIIADDYVQECVAALARSGADNVGGRMYPVANGLFGEAVALATTSRFGVGGARFHYSEREEFVDTVYMGAWKRKVFDEIGMFDSEQVRNQDDEFNYRLRSRGGRVLLSPRIQSRYYNRCTPRSLWSQYYQYGYWKVRVLQKHRRQMRPRQFAPFLLVLVLTILLLAAPFSQVAAWMFVGCLGLYLGSNIIASIIVALRKPMWAALLLPLVFGILHFSYGCGFSVGLFRFWNRWRQPVLHSPT